MILAQALQPPPPHKFSINALFPGLFSFTGKREVTFWEVKILEILVSARVVLVWMEAKA